MIVLLIISIPLFFGGISTSYAEPGINAYNIQITKEHVTAQGVCSCSLCTDRKHHTRTFINYCPYCKKYGVLNFEQASYWQEGLWYCTHCDADFCLIHGKEHRNPTQAYLTPYNGNIQEYIVQEGYFTGKKIQNTNTTIQAPSIEEYNEITITNGQKYKISKEKIEKITNEIHLYSILNHL